MLTRPPRPVRTFNTAAVYYHKFRLVHSDVEYSFIDAAAAALFTACKIEDTLKKSREILCAASNLKLAQTDHLSPDDSVSRLREFDIEAELIGISL
jgi:CTD kinase subunit beta